MYSALLQVPDAAAGCKADVPPVLYFHAEGFESHAAEGDLKLNTPLLLPLDDLKLRRFLSSVVLRPRYAIQTCHSSSTSTTSNSSALSASAARCGTEAREHPHLVGDLWRFQRGFKRV